MKNLEVNDLFGHRFTIPFVPSAEIDYSIKCFVFPGQGAAFPGMGRSELQEFPILQKRFQIADLRATDLGLPSPSLYIENPSEIKPEQLSLVRNLALFTLSIGLFEVAVSSGQSPRILTGHSFGEYAAFVAAGILSFEEMLAIVAEREKLSPPARQLGSMIAVAAGADDLRKISEIKIEWFANLNSPQQTVLSVPADDVKETSRILKKNRLGARVLEAIPQPYHSFLMQETARRLADFIDSQKFDFRPPHTPILSSVTGEILSSKNFSPNKAKEMLALQLTSPVNFIRQIESIYGKGIKHFVEISLNRIGSDWIRDILGGSQFKVSFPKVLQLEDGALKKKQVRRDHDSKLVGLLSKVVSSVTGYSISEISLSKNFQEDLGIDSIKKAQIVLNFLESQGDGAGGLQDGVLMNQIRTIEDVLNWYAMPRERKTQASVASFSLYRPEWWDAPLTAVDFEIPPVATEWIAFADASRSWRPETTLKAVVFYDDHRPFDFNAWLNAFRENDVLIRKQASSFLIGCVTDDRSTREVRALDGFLKSAAKEWGCDYQAFRFDHFEFGSRCVVVEEELRRPRLPTVRFEGMRRKILHYQPFVGEPEIESGLPKTVVAIGGASGLTYELLKSLAEKGTKRFVILGRRSREQISENLEALAASGARVDYLSGDSTRQESLESLFHLLKGDVADLVLHGGGFEHSAIIAQQDDINARNQIEIKLKTTLHLRSLASKFKMRKVLLLASTAGEFGNAGQSVYAYANQLMVFAADEASSEGLPFATICWPAWDHVGMTEKEEIAQQLRLTGLHLLKKDNGLELFGELLSVLDKEQRVVCMDSQFKSMEMEKPRSRTLQMLLPGLTYLHFPATLQNWTFRGLPALQDHLIMGQSLVPISFVLTFLWHMNVLLKGSAVTIEDLNAISFMVLHRRDSPYSLDRSFENGKEVFEVRSNQPHIKAFIGANRLEVLNAPSYREPPNCRLVDMSKQAYGLFGRRLHLMENTRVSDDDRAFAEVDCTKHSLFPGCESVNRQLVVVEALFHLSGACSDVKTGRVSVPLSVQSFSVNEHVTVGTKFHLVVHCRYPNSEIIEADLYAYNEKGELFLSILGEKLRLFAEGIRG